MAVYFIQCRESGYIKIGYARNPKMRLTELQIANWDVLQIVALDCTEETTERQYHARFDHLRKRGEWFAPAPDLLEVIERHRVNIPVLPTVTRLRRLKTA